MPTVVLVNQSEYMSLVNQRAKLTKWFNDYLELNSDKMDDVPNTDPIWQPYNEQSKIYSKVEDRIKVIEYVLQSQ